MNTLRITLLGSVRLEHGESKQEEKLTATPCALLAFLVLFRQRFHPREVLLNLMWGDLPPERARGCLNTALWRLRRRLEPQGVPSGTYLISTSAGELAFNCMSDYWLDVAAFEEITNHVMHTPPAHAGEKEIYDLENAISLYTGDLLESQYCDWVVQERERLRNLMLDARYYLMNHYQNRQDYPRALAHGAQILSANLLREDVHRQMMRLYNESGQRSMAVRQYQLCRQALFSELNIEPMPETRLLFEQISGYTSLKPGTEDNQNEVNLALAHLHTAIETVNQARLELEQALERLH